MNRRFGHRRSGGRGAKRGGGAPGPATPATIDGGATLWWRPAGITAASGVVASWDSEGSNTLRLANALTAERPTLVTVGGLDVPQFDGSDDVLFAEAPFTPLEPYTLAVLLRCDTWVANRRIFDSGSAAGGYLAWVAGTGNELRYEQGATDLQGAGAYADGGWYSVILDVRGDGATSTIYRQGVSDGTLAGTALAPIEATIAFGAVAATGANSAAITLADAAIWNGQGAEPTIADIFAYHQSVAATLGVSLAA